MKFRQIDHFIKKYLTNPRAEPVAKNAMALTKRGVGEDKKLESASIRGSKSSKNPITKSSIKKTPAAPAIASACQVRERGVER